MISADVARIPEVAQEVADLEGIAEVYSVTGEVDLIAIARVAQHDDLATVVADRLGKVEGVLATTTYIAFNAYSRHDLEQAFHIGLD
jgi:DNA-binding Lrp family transcriptional regulator